MLNIALMLSFLESQDPRELITRGRTVPNDEYFETLLE